MPPKDDLLLLLAVGLPFALLSIYALAVAANESLNCLSRHIARPSQSDAIETRRRFPNWGTVAMYTTVVFAVILAIGTPVLFMVDADSPVLQLPLEHIALWMAAAFALPYIVLGLTDFLLRIAHLSPRNDTATLDAMRVYERLEYLETWESGEIHENAIARLRDILDAGTTTSTQERILRDLLGGISIATGFRSDVSLYLINVPTINSAIWGGGTQGVHLAVTRGALEHLDRSGLEAMLMNMMVRRPHLARITGNSVEGLRQKTDSQFIPDYRGPEILYAADQETVQRLRDPEILLRTMFTLQKTGATIEKPSSKMLHRGHFFAWPRGGSSFDAALRDRIERLHRLLEVKGRATEGPG